jgi:hypothetical protein
MRPRLRRRGDGMISAASAREAVGRLRRAGEWSITGVLLLSVAVGVGVAIMASHRPFAVYSVLSVACLVVSGLRVVLALQRHSLGQKIARSQPDGVEAIRKHGLLFYLWFDQYNLFWATCALVVGFGMFSFFGPANHAMIVMAAGLTCGVWSVFGALPVVWPRTLGLCWRSPLPASPRRVRGCLDYAGAVMMLRRRREHARENDWARGGTNQLLITAVHELTGSGRPAPALRFWRRELENGRQEHQARALILGVMFVVTLLLAALLVPPFAGNESLSFPEYLSRLTAPLRGGRARTDSRSGGQQATGSRAGSPSNSGGRSDGGQQASGGNPGAGGGNASVSPGSASGGGGQQVPGNSAGAQAAGGGGGQGANAGTQGGPAGAGQAAQGGGTPQGSGAGGKGAEGSPGAGQAPQGGATPQGSGAGGNRAAGSPGAGQAAQAGGIPQDPGAGGKGAAGSPGAGQVAQGGGTPQGSGAGGNRAAGSPGAGRTAQALGTPQGSGAGGKGAAGSPGAGQVAQGGGIPHGPGAGGKGGAGDGPAKGAGQVAQGGGTLQGSGAGGKGASGPPAVGQSAGGRGAPSAASQNGASSANGRGGPAGPQGGPSKSYGTSGPRPQLASHPVTLTPLPHKSGKIINIEMPSHWPASEGSKGERPPDPADRSRDVPGQRVPYRPNPDSKGPAGEPARTEPYQHWPNWVYSILHK